MFNPEAEDTIVLWNAGNYNTINMVLHPIKLTLSSTAVITTNLTTHVYILIYYIRFKSGADFCEPMCSITGWDMYSSFIGPSRHQHRSSSSQGWLHVRYFFALSHQPTTVPQPNVLPPSESPGQKLTTSQVLVMLTNTSFAIICIHSMVFCFVTHSQTWWRKQYLPLKHQQLL